ncbi:C-type lectin domain family 17, member A-like, partial [Argopecten irradians]|uniref:C-type lectin domain family 17, member A-like n=1 Tax=Argopecten irradians TaxID=31199 RepID=UPI003718227A
AECRKDNANLVKIESHAETNWLKVFAGSLDRPWIGANDRAREGDWRWVGDNSKLTFKNWYPGMPDNTRNEDCAHIYPGWKWNDGSCSSGKQFICEKEGRVLGRNRWCWPGNCGNNNYAKDCQCVSPSFTTVVDDKPITM